MKENKTLKDHGLWLFTRHYKFGGNSVYKYDGVVTSKVVAKFMDLPMTQEVLDAINKNFDYFKKALEEDETFNDFLTDSFYEDASFKYYHD